MDLPDDPMTPTELSYLAWRYRERTPDDCQVCGAPVALATRTFAGTSYRCSAATERYRRATDGSTRESEEEHLVRSTQWIDFRGDTEVRRAIGELRDRRRAAGERVEVPVGEVLFPHGHGPGRCDVYYRHLGHDEWERIPDRRYEHDRAHAHARPHALRS